MSFVLPDSLIEKSEFTLAKASFLPCPQPEECPKCVSIFVQHPYTHFHIDNKLSVSLFRKSDLTWDFPEFETGYLDSSPDIMCASDLRLPTHVPGRGAGRFLENSTIRILSPLKYCEAVIWLFCRDLGTTLQIYWYGIIAYIMGYVDGTDIFHAEELREGFKQYYSALCRYD